MQWIKNVFLQVQYINFVLLLIQWIQLVLPRFSTSSVCFSKFSVSMMCTFKSSVSIEWSLKFSTSSVCSKVQLFNGVLHWRSECSASGVRSIKFNGTSLWCNKFIASYDHSSKSSTTTYVDNSKLFKDFQLTRFTNFDDRPQRFNSWSSSFRNVVRELYVAQFEKMDLLVKWLDPGSSKFARTLRSANTPDPSLGVFGTYWTITWAGHALKKKLHLFPTLKNKDHPKLYYFLALSSILNRQWLIHNTKFIWSIQIHLLELYP